MCRYLCTRKIIADVKIDVWGTHNLDLCNKPSNEPPWQTFKSNLANYTVPSEIVNIIGGRYVPSLYRCPFEIGPIVTIT
jgi:hypothetical protein